MTNPQFETMLAALDAAPPQDYSEGYDTAQLIELDASLADVQVQDATVPTPAGDITVRVYRPTAMPSTSALVWAHGGAWVGGSINMPEGHWVGLSLAARGVTVYSVDYHVSLRGITFPVPSDDVIAAFDWARTDRRATGAADAAVHLGGASAGGNLAAGAAKRLARRDTPPASLILAYPSLHAELPEPSPELAAAIARVDFPNTLPGLLAFTMVHFAGEAGVHDEIAVPSNGAVPAGHPQTLILNADADPLRASGELYGSLLRDAGVSVEIDCLPGSLHGFLNEPEGAFGREGIDRIAHWLAR